eukprot:gene21725-22674_t
MFGSAPVCRIAGTPECAKGPDAPAGQFAGARDFDRDERSDSVTMRYTEILSGSRPFAKLRTVCLAGLIAVAATGSARADEPQWRHGVSLVGSLKYPADFKRFDYVNPDAPKGGTLRLSDTGTFTNFNVTLADTKGDLAPGIGLIYQRLTTGALDEISSDYGEIAEAL